MNGSRSPAKLDAFFSELNTWMEEAGDSYETLRYGEHPSQELDLRLPSGDGPHPVALVCHGGFWRAEFTRRNTAAVCVALTRAGWATANVEYRRLGPGAYAPMLADVASAARYLDGLDASLSLGETTAIGHSAGAQLALWLASTGGATSAVALAGVCDLERAARARLGGDAVREFLGGSLREVPEAYADADPGRKLPLRVPQLLAHGTEDDRVPIEHAHSYARRARAAGDDCRLVELEGADHFDVIDPRYAGFDSIMEAIPR